MMEKREIKRTSSVRTVGHTDVGPSMAPSNGGITSSQRNGKSTKVSDLKCETLTGVGVFPMLESTVILKVKVLR